MRPTTEQRPFNFGLSDPRLAEIAREMADNLERVKVLEDNLDAAKEAKKEVPALMQHVRELGSFIKNGAESKQVECRIVYDDPEAGVKSIYRTDTDEHVESMEMTGAELQGELSIDEKGKLSLPEKIDPTEEHKEDDGSKPGN